MSVEAILCLFPVAYCVLDHVLFKFYFREKCLKKSNPMKKGTPMRTTLVWKSSCCCFGNVSCALTVPRLLLIPVQVKNVSQDGFNDCNSFLCLLYASHCVFLLVFLLRKYLNNIRELFCLSFLAGIFVVVMYMFLFHFCYLWCSRYNISD